MPIGKPINLYWEYMERSSICIAMAQHLLEARQFELAKFYTSAAEGYETKAKDLTLKEA